VPSPVIGHEGPGQDTGHPIYIPADSVLSSQSILTLGVGGGGVKGDGVEGTAGRAQISGCVFG
jgi:hypothetical protein